MKDRSMDAQERDGSNADVDRDVDAGRLTSGAPPRSAVRKAEPKSDRVDEASAESFPASDPPS